MATKSKKELDVQKNSPSIDQTKQILITGAGGALAQHVISILKRDYRIVAVDFRRRVELGEDIPSYKVDFNKRGFEDIFRTYEFDGVLHLGRMGLHEANRTRRYNMNVLGTQKLFDLCLKYNVHQVLVLSTHHVYGADAYNPALLDESFPLKASELTQDLVDSVELENLSTIYKWKHPDLHITILRPCNIVGPGVRNTISMLLSQKYAPILFGFSPLMQFIHVEDMAEAIATAFSQNHSGIYNVAPDDWVAYQDALSECNCNRLPILSLPPSLPKLVSKVMNSRSFPEYLVNYFKYPVILDGSLFRETFKWKPGRSLEEIFSYYRDIK